MAACIHLSLCESQQRQSRLRISSGLAGLPIHLLRLRELAPETKELRPLVEGRANGALGRLCETFARPLGFVYRVGPGAVQLQDLGAAHQALATKAHEIGLRRTPSIECRRPLVRAAQVENLVTGFEHAAIDIAGRDRGDLAGSDGDHRFVQQRHALANSFQPDQRPAAAVQGHRDQIHIAEPASNVGGLAKQGVRRFGIAFSDAPDSGRHEEIAVHDALVGPFREHSLSPRDPSSAAREVALVQQSKREPERASRSALPVAAAEERLVRASQDIFAVGVFPVR